MATIHFKVSHFDNCAPLTQQVPPICLSESYRHPFMKGSQGWRPLDGEGTGEASLHPVPVAGREMANHLDVGGYRHPEVSPKRRETMQSRSGPILEEIIRRCGGSGSLGSEHGQDQIGTMRVIEGTGYHHCRPSLYPSCSDEVHRHHITGGQACSSSSTRCSRCAQLALLKSR